MEDTISLTLETSQVNRTSDSPRVAWLLQGAGAYWQPIVSEFARLFPRTTVFTACWSGFMPGFEGSFTVQQVGKMKVLEVSGQSKGYSTSFTYLSPGIVGHLLQFKPHVIFSTGFSIWTILALLLKTWCRWQIVIMYDGSSPGVDYRGSWLRLFQRRLMARFTDAFITNVDTGKAYLTEVIGARKDTVFVRPYLVPHPKTYLQNRKDIEPVVSQLQRPVFLFVGGIIPRKGVHELLQACSILQAQGYQDYTLLIVGDGSQKPELEGFVKNHNLENQVKWVGGIEYEQVGAYFQQADVFVFSTLEDVWGLVAVEAMMFGKPILCSKWAGAVEVVVEGENGYVFDPHDPKKLAELMHQFINDPSLINRMGSKSERIMAGHTPGAVATFLAKVVEFVQSNQKETVS